MNEEKLNVKEEKMFLYQILEEHIENDKKHFNPCQECIRLGLQKGFQKGKLQAQKEEEGFLISIDNYYGFEDCMIKLHEKLQKRIKQLQKEINSQTEQNSDKEVAQPYSKSDKTTKEIGSNSK